MSDEARDQMIEGELLTVRQGPVSVYAIAVAPLLNDKATVSKLWRIVEVTDIIQARQALGDTFHSMQYIGGNTLLLAFEGESDE